MRFQCVRPICTPTIPCRSSFPNDEAIGQRIALLTDVLHSKLSTHFALITLFVFGLCHLYAPNADAQRVRRAKRVGIISTLGPSNAKAKVMKKMLRAGTDMARLNMSHMNAKAIGKLVGTLRSIEKKGNLKRTPLLADLPGGKVRLGKLQSKPVLLKDGQTFTLTTNRQVTTTQTRASVGYANLAKHIEAGDTVMIFDGKIQLTVVSKKANGDVVTVVKKAGELKSKMGFSILGKELPFPTMTQQDRRKLKIAVANHADLIGVSMVQGPKNLLAVRRALDKMGAKNTKIVAKIESVEAMKNLREIIAHSDMVMIARGDLGTAVGLKNLPAAQAKIAAEANRQGKQFIAATNYMDSMRVSTSPSQANQKDVKSTLKQGPTFFMLNETAVGKYPVKTVRELKKLIQKDQHN